MKPILILIDGQQVSMFQIKEGLKSGSLLEWKAKIFQFIVEWFSPNDFILQKTSGSTGEPKVIKLKKSAMIASAQKTIDFFQLKPNNTAWLCLPIEYIAGKMMVVRALVGNMNLIVSEPSGTPSLPDQIVDFAAMVPLQIQKLIDANADLSQIKKLIIGGASINHNLSKLLQSIPTEAYATYGMTETCSHIALQRINGNNPDALFHLLPGISISTNNHGCLYINAPELLEKPVETTDLVELHSPTEFTILGRVDNVINSGGIKISPENLESQISLLLGVDCLVVPQQDELLGQKLVLVIETNSKPTLNKLNKLKHKLEKHLCPKFVCLIEKFPRKESMKIDRSLVFEYLRVSKLNYWVTL